MADEKIAGISFDLEFDLGKIKKSLSDIMEKVDTKLTGAFNKTAKNCDTSCESMSKSFKKANTDISKEISEVDAKIQKILADSEKTMKSKASSIAWIYKKQGMSQSEAMKKAWGEIERTTESSSKKVKKNVSGIGSKSKDVADTMESSFKKSFKKIASLLAAAFSIRQLISFGKSCIDLGSDLQEVQNVVDVTFPNMSKQIDKFAKNAAGQFGLSETMAKKFSGTFGSMAEAFGFTEKEAYKMSTALTGLAGDIASFYNISQDEAYTKLKSVFSGETETLKDLGVVMTQSALDAYALANGYGKVTSKMTEAEKVSLRFAFVQDQLANATGDFARTSNSWANQTRILSLQFDSLKASIGQGLINAFTPVIKVVNTLLAKVQTLASAFKKLTENFFGSAGSSNSTEETAVKTSDAMDTASSASSDVANNTTKAAKAAEKLKASVMGFDKLNKLDSQDTSSNDTSTNGSGGSVTTTTTTNKSSGDTEKEIKKTSKFEKVLEKIKKKLAPLTNAISNFIDAAKPLVGAFGKGVLVFFERFAKYIGEPAIKFAAKIINLLAGALRKLDPDLVQAAATALCEVAAGILAIKIGKSTLSALGSLKNKLSGLTKFEKTAIAVTVAITAIEFAHIKWKKIFDEYSMEEVDEALKMMFQDVFGSSKLAKVAAEGFAGFFKTWGAIFAGEYSPTEWIDAFGQWASDCWAGFCDGFHKVTSGIKNWLSDNIYTPIKKAFCNLFGIHSPSKVFKEWGRFCITGFLNGLKENVSKVLQWFKELPGKIEKKLGDLFGKFSKKGKEVVSSIKTGAVENWKSASKWFTELPGKIMNALGDIKTKAKNKGKEILDGLKSGFSKENLKKSFKDAFKGAVNGAISIVNKFIRSINEKLTFKIDDVKLPGGKTIKGTSISLGSLKEIPALATGGYVEANTPQLAMIGDNRHQGEVVAPEDKLQSMVDSAVQQNTANIISALKEIFQGMNKGGNIELVVNIGSKKIMQTVLKAANAGNKRMGKTVYNV